MEAVAARTSVKLPAWALPPGPNDSSGGKGKGGRGGRGNGGAGIVADGTYGVPAEGYGGHKGRGKGTGSQGGDGKGRGGRGKGIRSDPSEEATAALANLTLHTATPPVVPTPPPALPPAPPPGPPPGPIEFPSLADASKMKAPPPPPPPTAAPTAAPTASRTVAPPAAPPAAPSSWASKLGAAGAQPPEELRIDITDGNAYTKAEFVAEYGGTKQWDTAKPVAGAPPLAAGSAGSAGSTAGSATVLSAVGAGTAAAAAGMAGSATPRISPTAALAAAEAAGRTYSQMSLCQMYDVRLLQAPVEHVERRPQTFEMLENVRGKRMNTLSGLALFRDVLSPSEQILTLAYVRRLSELGDDGALIGRTYSAPRKWMRGKGRITVQMGCCYNYAYDKQGNPPGIMPKEPVCGMPPFLHDIIDRMVQRGIFTAQTRPDSCIINFYTEGDCIPPHIDHLDFTRPFVTLSLLSEQPILFGEKIAIVNDGEFAAPFSIPLPVGSVLVLDGNGANVAKHCVPAVGADRVSITFRQIDHRKIKMTAFVGPDGRAG
eukprot:jgi/Chrpa1/17691/Chrysochromulina_OHIO_Genome00006143-RA